MKNLRIQILAFVVLSEENDKALVVSQRNRRGYHLEKAHETVVRVMVSRKAECEVAVIDRAKEKLRAKFRELGIGNR